MVRPKLCLMCNKKIISSWESTCEECWKKIIEHDLCPMCRGNKTIPTTQQNGEFKYDVTCPTCGGTGWTGEWRIYIVTLNHLRETIRDCGIDFQDLEDMW